MKTLYFDCFAGASGDMILGAMIDAGVSLDALRLELAKLNVDGFKLDAERVNRSGLSASYARVHTVHELKHRHLSDIVKIIDASTLSEPVKQRAKEIFQRLAEAEARVHNEPLDHVHFHEVGALDAIVDVVGAAVCFDLLGIERFVASPLHVGSGTVEMGHGRFPVPPPAVTELLKGVPFYSGEIKGELLTPTGAAIITTVCNEFGPMPQMMLEANGYGAGSREYDKFPNVLRVMIGGSDANLKQVRHMGSVRDSDSQMLWMLETNVDDASPQIIGHVMERALELGALDCYFTPVQMKKNRPGVLLSVLCDDDKAESLTNLLFTETTTLGVRKLRIERRALERSIVRVETQYGKIDVKVARLNGQVVNEAPEFEQCKQAAAAAGVPVKVVESAVRVALARENKE